MVEIWQPKDDLAGADFFILLGIQTASSATICPTPYALRTVIENEVWNRERKGDLALVQRLCRRVYFQHFAGMKII